MFNSINEGVNLMRFFFLLFSIFSLTLSAYASPYILKQLPDAQKKGEYSFSYFIWDVYDITLYVQDNSSIYSGDIALSLRYKRDLNGKDITERSIEEIKNIGFRNKKYLSLWQDKMNNIFPDVTNGTVLTGIRKKGTTSFYHNGKFVGAIDDPLFSKYFFGIWLSPQTSEPEMRASLLGI